MASGSGGSAAPKAAAAEGPASGGPEAGPSFSSDVCATQTPEEPSGSHYETARKGPRVTIDENHPSMEYARRLADQMTPLTAGEESAPWARVLYVRTESPIYSIIVLPASRRSSTSIRPALRRPAAIRIHARAQIVCSSHHRCIFRSMHKPPITRYILRSRLETSDI